MLDSHEKRSYFKLSKVIKSMIVGAMLFSAPANAEVPIEVLDPLARAAYIHLYCRAYGLSVNPHALEYILKKDAYPVTVFSEGGKYRQELLAMLGFFQHNLSKYSKKEACQIMKTISPELIK